MKTYQVRLLEFELSSKCNAACPQCPRVDPDFLPDKSFLDTDNEITLQNVKDWFSLEILKSIYVAKFMGSYSDPCIARDFFSIVKYIRENNNSAEIHVHTNGSLRKAEWWSELGNIIGKKGYVTFGIDGLADTHSIYRINTSYEKVIENARAFIAGGGVANWQFIVFKHNQHQIESCRQLSKELGFNNFIVMGSDRFKTNSSAQKTVNGDLLEPSDIVDNITQTDLWSEKKSSYIECLSNKVEWITVDWNGDVFPCCMSSTWNRGGDDDAIYWQQKILQGNIKRNNLHHTSLQDVLYSINELYTDIKNGTELKVCKAFCSKYSA